MLILLLYFRYAFPWWREKEIVSDERRSQGLCPLTPEEAALVLRALGFGRETQIYIAAGEIYGGERRLAQLRASFPQIVSFHWYCSFSYHFSVYCLDLFKMALMLNNCVLTP